MLDLNFYKTIEILGLTQPKENLLEELEKLYKECGGNEELFKKMNPIKCERYLFRGSTRLDENTVEEVYYDSRSPWGKVLYEDKKEIQAKDKDAQRKELSSNLNEENGEELGINPFADDKSNKETIKEMKITVSAYFNRLTETEKRRILKYANGKNLREIALEEGVCHSKIQNSIDSVKKKFMNKL